MKKILSVFLSAVLCFSCVTVAFADEDDFRIVRSKRFSIKPMSPEEAILQMNLLGHEFFVFKNTDAEEAISVVYTRKNGGYGLICDDGMQDY